MATLTTEQRATLWAELMRELSRDGETVGITKPELRAAVDALDTWLDTNAANHQHGDSAASKGSTYRRPKSTIAHVHCAVSIRGRCINGQSFCA